MSQAIFALLPIRKYRRTYVYPLGIPRGDQQSALADQLNSLVRAGSQTDAVPLHDRFQRIALLETQSLADFFRKNDTTRLAQNNGIFHATFGATFHSLRQAVCKSLRGAEEDGLLGGIRLHDIRAQIDALLQAVETLVAEVRGVME